MTPYHARYLAHELTKRCPSDSVEKLAGTLFDAKVDLNPHQIEAALFAFKSPLSKGALLADEVGLGKTIEAGILLSQFWAEGRRKILLVMPASLRKQWSDELKDKFYLPSTILEGPSFNKAIKSGESNPFDRSGTDPSIVICSYQFAAGKDEFLLRTPWDLVVMDEAHRMRNVWKPQNKTARILRAALANRPKVLLTATPLQNSLMELYGLVSFIDELAFGDQKAFSSQYSRLTDESFAHLKVRLAPLCHRTLRRQVGEYVKYTNRRAITQEFTPGPDEQALYEMVSEYLQRDALQALPASQRALMTLVLRKLLASSTYAIAGALNTMVGKLQKRLRDNEKFLENSNPPPEPSAESEAEIEAAFQTADLAPNDDSLEVDDLLIAERIATEWNELPPTPDTKITPEINPTQPSNNQEEDDWTPLSPEEMISIQGEITELSEFRDLATSISENAKGEALLAGLKNGFDAMQELGGARKAIIFTESRRTQDYLLGLLSESSHADKIVLFNGSNADPESRKIYAEWKTQHQGSDRITGSRTADMRSALVDQFREHAEIMIATEAAAEGINLQFCSLVVNYDLPWNPQRIEQRIGRCHRYGQQHDVVVVNFLNKNNAADERVYELLNEKFKLFDRTFDTSDEILGSIENGVDFERRIVDLYQRCRQPEQIQMEFDLLREELKPDINAAMENTRQQLLENFDAEVHDRLRVNLREGQAHLDRYSDMLWRLTEYALRDRAAFYPGEHAFSIGNNPFPNTKDIHLGRYEMARESEHGHRYRLGHPLAHAIIEEAKTSAVPFAQLTFDYSSHDQSIAALAPFVGSSGFLSASSLSVTAGTTEDHLLLVAQTTDGTPLPDDLGHRLFTLPVTVEEASPPSSLPTSCALAAKATEVIDEIGKRTSEFFDQEMDKLDGWANDQRKSHKTTLTDFDKQIKELKKDIRQAANVSDKLNLQRQTQRLEREREDAWRAYEAEARTVEEKKDQFLDEIEQRITLTHAESPLFQFQWTIR